jgi:N-methylhydantoinase A/oxoprolinase/acetone carboxylase beta subunit
MASNTQPPLGMIVGLIIGRAARAIRVMASKRVVNAAQRDCDRALAKVSNDSQRAINRLQEQAEKDRADARKRINTVAAGRGRICAESEKRQAAIRKKHEQAIDKIKKATESEIKVARKRLIGHMNGKPESAKRDFPAYVKAKREGYKDGLEPSSIEMEMTNIEREQALRKLRGW